MGGGERVILGWRRVSRSIRGLRGLLRSAIQAVENPMTMENIQSPKPSD